MTVFFRHDKVTDSVHQIEAASSPSSVSSLSMIYKWRLEQEHDMKARNGGKGMTDEAVKLYVDTSYFN